MSKEECYELGYIAKTIGLKGEVAVVLDVDDVEDYEDLDSILIEIDGELVPYKVEKVNIRTNKTSMRFGGIDIIEKAEKLRGKKLYLPLDTLESLEEGAYYLHELVGYQVDDANHGLIGTVNVIYNLPGQDLLALMYKGVEVMIPINEAIILEVIHESKLIKTNLPEGLLEIYTN